MIVPDVIFRDRTCLVFCFLGCVGKFQAREANSWPTSASSNPGNRVCVLFVFLFFFSEGQRSGKMAVVFLTRSSFR